MASRLASRIQILGLALWQSVLTAGRRHPPSHPQRILIAHHLLLGDTLMLTPLLAKLRQQYPDAELVMTTPKPIAPLYATRPYGVLAVPFDPRDRRTLATLRRRGGYDLAIVPGDNRYSWLARALGARWIVAFAGDRPAYKNWPVDKRVSFPQTAMQVGDMMTLLTEGPAPAPYAPAHWPMPDGDPLVLPDGPYAVLHVGASNELRRWVPEKWREVIGHLKQRGLQCVFSGAESDRAHIHAIDPTESCRSCAGTTTLPQLWHLLAHADLLICPDTGIAHLGRIVGVPTVTLFGQGSPVLFGAGDFWRHSRYRAVWLPDFPCRDQRILFKREAAWIRRCSRTPRECPAPRCMQGIAVASVLDAIDSLLNNARP